MSSKRKNEFLSIKTTDFKNRDRKAYHHEQLFKHRKLSISDSNTWNFYMELLIMSDNVDVIWESFGELLTNCSVTKNKTDLQSLVFRLLEKYRKNYQPEKTSFRLAIAKFLEDVGKSKVFQNFQLFPGSISNEQNIATILDWILYFIQNEVNIDVKAYLITSYIIIGRFDCKPKFISILKKFLVSTPYDIFIKVSKRLQILRDFIFSKDIIELISVCPYNKQLNLLTLLDTNTCISDLSKMPQIYDLFTEMMVTHSTRTFSHRVLGTVIKACWYRAKSDKQSEYFPDLLIHLFFFLETEPKQKVVLYCILMYFIDFSDFYFNKLIASDIFRHLTLFHNYDDQFNLWVLSPFIHNNTSNRHFLILEKYDILNQIMNDITTISNRIAYPHIAIRIIELSRLANIKLSHENMTILKTDKIMGKKMYV